MSPSSVTGIICFDGLCWPWPPPPLLLVLLPVLLLVLPVPRVVLPQDCDTVDEADTDEADTDEADQLSWGDPPEEQLSASLLIATPPDPILWGIPIHNPKIGPVIGVFQSPLGWSRMIVAMMAELYP
jgi:hypothetical protein